MTFNNANAPNFPCTGSPDETNPLEYTITLDPAEYYFGKPKVLEPGVYTITMRLYTGNDKTASGLFWDKDVSFTITDPCNEPSRVTSAKADP